MKDLFSRDPKTLSPTARRLALFSARLAAVVAPVMTVVLVVVALAHFFFEVGNYPEPRHRYAVGALFLLLFAPVTLGIGFLARTQVRALIAYKKHDAR